MSKSINQQVHELCGFNDNYKWMVCPACGPRPCFGSYEKDGVRIYNCRGENESCCGIKYQCTIDQWQYAYFDKYLEEAFKAFDKFKDKGLMIGWESGKWWVFHVLNSGHKFTKCGISGPQETIQLAICHGIINFGENNAER